MDEVTSFIVGGAVGIALVVSYKIYSTVNSVIEKTGSIVTYINKNLSIGKNNLEENSV